METSRTEMLRAPTMRRTLILLTVAFAGLLSPFAPVEAQRFSNYGQVRLGDGLPDIPGGFTFCRLAYTAVRRVPSGNGWTTDFPMADRNLSTRLGELTPTQVSKWTHGEPGYSPVRITDPEVYQCPFLMASHVGSIGFNDAEVAAMRDFLLKGGFFWADDFWGSASWEYFASEIGRVLPEFEIVDLSLDHPLFSIVYEVPEVPQIPSINSWRRMGGGTSELGSDSATPHLRAIVDDRDRILVLITHNTDIADGWEREGEDADYFYLFSPDAYAIGVNVAVWTMTH